MFKINILVKKLKENAVIPTRGSEKAAGYDLYAVIDSGSVIIPPHKRVPVGTGLAFALPDGYFGAIFARSGLATNQSLRPANCVGVCDSDYRGEYIIPLHNDSDEEKTINTGDRIAQLVIMPFLPATFDETDTLDDTQRGTGGFGSTGK